MRSPKNARDDRARTTRAEAAAARLALLAADLGAADPAPDEQVGSDEWWSDHTRIAPARRAAPAPVPAPAPTADEQSDVGPPELPNPGRHAARRRRRPLAAATPSLPALGPAQLTVVAVLVAAALALTAWWVLRSQAEPVPPPLAPGSAEPLVAAASGSTAATASPTATGTVTVDVTGKVRRPGIVVLETGSRVVDALEAAGGARPGADLAGINLARLLGDGEQIVVGTPETAGSAVPIAPGATSPSAPTALVNLNLATPAELETLPDVGPVTAAAIVAWRDEHGGFTSVEQLLEVVGIGEVTLASIAPHVTV